jgi:hypothetical protein
MLAYLKPFLPFQLCSARLRMTPLLSGAIGAFAAGLRQPGFHHEMNVTK